MDVKAYLDMMDESRPRDYNPEKHGWEQLDRVIYNQIPDLYSDCSSKISQKRHRRANLKDLILKAIEHDRAGSQKQV